MCVFSINEHENFNYFQRKVLLENLSVVQLVNQLSTFMKIEGAKDSFYEELEGNIFNTWKNYACQLLNVHGASGIRRTGKHTTR